jgi:hypothetical protein
MVGGPPSHNAIREGGGHHLQYEVHRAATHPTPQTLTRPEGALERREAPPPPPPRPSSWIRRTWCHRPTLDRIVRDTAVPEPALLPLRQAAAAPATTTCEMASNSAPPSNPDGLRPCFPFVLLLVVLGVVDLDQECVYLHIVSIHPCRSTASGPVIFNMFVVIRV